MENIPLLLTILGIHTLAMISPGPDFAVVIKNAIQHNRKTGMATAIGLSLGVMVHITYCILGLAIIISKSILVFNILKYLGAAYLVYIGVKSILAKDVPGATIAANQKTTNSKSLFGAVKDGFLTNILNPKVTLYFLSLFTLIITPQTPTWIKNSIAILLPLEVILWFSFVSLLVTTKPAISIIKKSGKWINRTFGVILVALGIKVASD